MSRILLLVLLLLAPLSCASERSNAGKYRDRCVYLYNDPAEQRRCEEEQFITIFRVEF